MSGVSASEMPVDRATLTTALVVVSIIVGSLWLLPFISLWLGIMLGGLWWFLFGPLFVLGLFMDIIMSGIFDRK